MSESKGATERLPATKKNKTSAGEETVKCVSIIAKSKARKREGRRTDVLTYPFVCGKTMTPDVLALASLEVSGRTLEGPARR